MITKNNRTNNALSEPYFLIRRLIKYRQQSSKYKIFFSKLGQPVGSLSIWELSPIQKSNKVYLVMPFFDAFQ